MRATWKPHEKSGTLTKRADLPSSAFAYPKERKEPMTNAAHVRNAVARFDQVTGVPQSERALAIANIKKAARYYGVDLSDTDFATKKPAPKKKPAARKKAPSRKKAAKKAPARKKKTARAKKARTVRKKAKR